jgi:hypothetical protein
VDFERESSEGRQIAELAEDRGDKVTGGSNAGVAGFQRQRALGLGELPAFDEMSNELLGFGHLSYQGFLSGVEWRRFLARTAAECLASSLQAWRKEIPFSAISCRAFSIQLLCGIYR